MPTPFIVDEMLGHVARWLRIAGYDTKFINDVSDAVLLELAIEEGRTLITSDRELSLKARKRGVNVLFVAPGDLLTALSQIAASLSIPMEPRMVKCTICNGNLKFWTGGTLDATYPTPKEGKDLWICEVCGKVYWKGTHWDSICKFLKLVSEESFKIRAKTGRKGP